MTTSNWWIYPNIAPLMTDFLMRLPSKWGRVTEKFLENNDQYLVAYLEGKTSMLAFHLTTSPLWAALVS